MDSQLAIERALRLLTPTPDFAGELPLELRTSLNVLIKPALERLAKSIAAERDESRRHLLSQRAATAVSIVAGVADLSTVITTDKLLPETVDRAEIRLSSDPNGFPFEWCTRGQLSLKLPTDAFFIRCALEGNLLYTRDTQGVLTSSLGAISIVANYIPNISGTPAALVLPQTLEGEFIHLLAMEIAGALPRQSRRESAPAAAVPATETEQPRRRP